MDEDVTMRLTRNQLRSLILREVRILSEQDDRTCADGRRAGHGLRPEQDTPEWDDWERRSAQMYQDRDEVFQWLVQAGELDAEFDTAKNSILGLDVTPEGAQDLAATPLGGRALSKPLCPEDFRVVPVKRPGQPVLYVVLEKD